MTESQQTKTALLTLKTPPRFDPLALQHTIRVLLSQPGQEAEFLQGLLSLVIGMINARGAVLFTQQNCRQQVWLEQTASARAELMPQLIELGAQATKATQLRKILRDNGMLWHLIVTPPENGLHLGVVLELGPQGIIEPFVLIIQLLALHLRFHAWQTQARHQEWLARQSAAAVELATTLCQQRDFSHTGDTLVNWLQEHLGCYQVALGITRGSHCRLQALSGMASFNRRMPLIRALQTAMSETLRARTPIHYPQQLQERVVQVDHAHQLLVNQQAAAEAFSVPLLVHDKIIGVCTLLWNQQQRSQKNQRDFVKALAILLGPLLHRLQHAEQGLIGLAWQSTRRLLQRWYYLLILLALILVTWLLRLPVAHVIRGDCELQPAIRRVIAAPFEGILLQSYVKPGDLVQAGQLLARLDGRELSWELAGLQADHAKAVRESEVALAQEQLARYQMAHLQAEKLALRMRTLRYRIDHLEIRAPLNGLVLSGDLERAQGVPVQTGQTLFELAPLKNMQVEIAVAARYIAYLHPGQTGQVRLEAFPEKDLPVTIDDIKPVAQIRDATNVFICEATLANADQRLRPGMKGQARLQAGQQPLWWILFHRPLEWLRLQLWW